MSIVHVTKSVFKISYTESSSTNISLIINIEDTIHCSTIFFPAR
ncbi:MAG: phenolic acid decarboxylase [Snodgrassella sp.]|nr:phenolic acid decarboxylase [Snodgrassella sp.]